MRLLGREMITVQPQQQTLTNGILVPSNNGASYTLYASVQPVSSAALQRLPEGSRASAKWMVYVEGKTKRISMGGPQAVPDKLTTSKGTLMPIAEIDFLGHSTGLPHMAYVCAQVGADE